MGVRLCHPFGNPFSYNAAIGLLQRGQLAQFHTCLYRPLFTHYRAHPELPAGSVTSHPFREAIRLAAASLPPGKWSGRQQWFIDWVASGFDEATAKCVRPSDRAVYCYEDSAAKTFQRAKDTGTARVYELPILHYREMQRIFSQEVERVPGVAEFLPTLQEPAWKLERKDLELLTADLIVVPAKFVRDSIQRFLTPAARFAVVPYGVDVPAAAKRWETGDLTGPVRLFFAGNLGPRKGLHILFRTLASFPESSFHLTLAGRWEHGFQDWLARQHNVSYEWLGQLPHADVFDAARRSHLFVFPSLAEGFGLVILESMAIGIPVLTTNQTAGPELIDNGKDGWVTPAGDAEALRERLEFVLTNRAVLPEMGVAARRKAEARSWSNYREELCAAVSGVAS